MRILIIRFSALGDIALTLPLIQKLNDKYPDLELFILSKPFSKELFASLKINFVHSNLNSEHKGVFGLFKLFKSIKREVKPDIVIDLHQVLRSKILSLFFRISGTGVFSIDKGRAEKNALVRRENKISKQLKHSTERYADVFEKAGFPLNFKPEDFHGIVSQQISQDQFEFPENKIKIGLAPMAQHTGKRWPIDNVKDLISALQKEGKHIYLFGGPEDVPTLEELAKDSNQIVNMAGKSGLQNEIQLMAKLDVFIAMDSSNMHLATMANIPVVSIWGATHSHAGFGPLGKNDDLKVEVAINELNCRPCSVFGNKECFRKDYACLHGINSNMVMEKINLALNKSSHDS